MRKLLLLVALLACATFAPTAIAHRSHVRAHVALPPKPACDAKCELSQLKAEVKALRQEVGDPEIEYVWATTNTCLSVQGEGEPGNPNACNGGRADSLVSCGAGKHPVGTIPIVSGGVAGVEWHEGNRIEANGESGEFDAFAGPLPSYGSGSVFAWIACMKGTVHIPFGY